MQKFTLEELIDAYRIMYPKTSKADLTRFAQHDKRYVDFTPRQGWTHAELLHAAQTKYPTLNLGQHEAIAYQDKRHPRYGQKKPFRLIGFNILGLAILAGSVAIFGIFLVGRGRN